MEHILDIKSFLKYIKHIVCCTHYEERERVREGGKEGGRDRERETSEQEEPDLQIFFSFSFILGWFYKMGMIATFF